MSDQAVACSARARRAGAIRIDVGRMLGRLQAATSGSGAMDAYLAACAAVQFWSDASAIEPRADVLRGRRHAEAEADRAAQALLRRSVHSPADTQQPSALDFSVSEAAGVALLEKLLNVPMPECCGYDLADLEIAADDAAQLVGNRGVARPVLLVGIRTGGTYLAPLWSAALRDHGVADVRWCTVRPKLSDTGVHGLESALDWLSDRPDSTVVVLDDQPDTGATMERVAALLRSAASDLWFSSVGKLWRDEAGRRVARHYGASTSTRERLWEYLLPEAHARFFDRLACTSGLPALPASATLQPRCPYGEARYGLGLPWLPWNHASVLSGRRCLVNPRKTPLVVASSDNQPLLHLRFIGEGVFGRAEFERAQRLDQRRQAWFVDGYCVTEDIGPSRLLRDELPAAATAGRADLLHQCADWMTRLTRESNARIHGDSMELALHARWAALRNAVRAHGCPLPPAGESLRRFLENPVRRFGRTGLSTRSSLRYACGAWHWQVDERGRVHRFQVEANWGDYSWPELELAAFLLANRVDLASAKSISALCALPYEDVQGCISFAALVIGEAMVRSVKTLSEQGCSLFLEDFQALLAAVCELVEIENF